MKNGNSFNSYHVKLLDGNKVSFQGNVHRVFKHYNVLQYTHVLVGILRY